MSSTDEVPALPGIHQYIRLSLDQFDKTKTLGLPASKYLEQLNSIGRTIVRIL